MIVPTIIITLTIIISVYVVCTVKGFIKYKSDWVDEDLMNRENYKQTSDE